MRAGPRPRTLAPATVHGHLPFASCSPTRPSVLTGNGLYPSKGAIEREATVVALRVDIGPVTALQRRPVVDKDLYGSIYGADFVDDAPSKVREEDR